MANPGSSHAWGIRLLRSRLAANGARLRLTGASGPAAWTDGSGRLQWTVCARSWIAGDDISDLADRPGRHYDDRLELSTGASWSTA